MFSLKENLSIRGFIRTPEKVLFKLTATSQTMTPFLGVANQNPVFQIPNIPKEYVQGEDPNFATAGRSKESQQFTISTYS